MKNCCTLACENVHVFEPAQAKGPQNLVGETLSVLTFEEFRTPREIKFLAKLLRFLVDAKVMWPAQTNAGFWRIRLENISCEKSECSVVEAHRCAFTL